MRRKAYMKRAHTSRGDTDIISKIEDPHDQKWRQTNEGAQVTRSNRDTISKITWKGKESSSTEDTYPVATQMSWTRSCRKERRGADQEATHIWRQPRHDREDTERYDVDCMWLILGIVDFCLWRICGVRGFLFGSFIMWFVVRGSSCDCKAVDVCVKYQKSVRNSTSHEDMKNRCEIFPCIWIGWDAT